MHQDSEVRAQNRHRPARALSSDASWVLLGNIAFTISQFLLLVILAKLGSVEKVGQFALANAIAAPVFMLSDLNLRAYLATDARNEYSFPTYLACRASCTALALGSLIVIGIGLGQRGEPLVVLASVGAVKAFESMGTIVFGLYQKHNRMKWLAASLITRSVLGVLGFALGLVLTRSLAWAVCALAISRLIVFVFYDVSRGRKLESLGISDNLRDALGLARSAMPLGVVMMLLSLNANLVLYFVESVLGTEEVGLFAALMYLISAGRVLINALSQTASPRLARLLQQRDHRGFEQLQRRLVLSGFAIGLGGAAFAWIFGEVLLELAYSPEYAEKAPLLIWLLLANSFAFANAFLGAGLTASRSFRQMIVINLFSLAVSALCLLVMVPWMGLVGAAAAIGVSAAAKLFLNLYLNAQRAHRRRAA